MFYLYLNFDFSIIPLFMLMGQFASKAGLSKSLFTSAGTFIGHRRGGIAILILFPAITLILPRLING